MAEVGQGDLSGPSADGDAAEGDISLPDAPQINQKTDAVDSDARARCPIGGTFPTESFPRKREPPFTEYA